MTFGLFWFWRFINLSLSYLVLRHLPTYLQTQDPHGETVWYCFKNLILQIGQTHRIQNRMFLSQYQKCQINQKINSVTAKHLCHESRGKAALVVVTWWNAHHNSGTWVVCLTGPATTRARVDDLSQQLWLQTKSSISHTTCLFQSKYSEILLV